MAPLQKLKTNNGNVLLEVVLCLPLILSVLSLTGFILFVLTAQMGLHHVAHEALICLAREGSAPPCKRQLLMDSKLFLKWGEIEDVELWEKSFRSSEILIRWRVNRLRFKVSREINWNDALRKRDFSL